jgi:hypothetical protein
VYKLGPMLWVNRAKRTLDNMNHYFLTTLFSGLLLALCNPTNAGQIEPTSHTSTGAAKSSGKLYKKDLINAISEADRIVISEHSDSGDFHDSEKDEMGQELSYVYRQVQLDAKLKAAFLALTQGLDETTQGAFAACVFEPHHTIKFYSGSRLKSTMVICFACGQVEWDGSSRTPPWSLYSGLEAIVGSAGFTPKQNWVARASAHTEVLRQRKCWLENSDSLHHCGVVDSDRMHFFH